MNASRHEVEPCLLCGASSAAVGLLRYRDERVEWGPRCRDHHACRGRVAANGEPWPLDDGAMSYEPGPRHRPTSPTDDEEARWW